MIFLTRSFNSKSTVTVFDGMRHHSIAGSNQFLMKFELTIPYKAPPTSSASFYAAANGGKKGFHVRMNMDLDVMAKFNEINSLYFKVLNLEIFLIIKCILKWFSQSSHSIFVVVLTFSYTWVDWIFFTTN